LLKLLAHFPSGENLCVFTRSGVNSGDFRRRLDSSADADVRLTGSVPVKHQQRFTQLS
jgi:hypothetical protein